MLKDLFKPAWQHSNPQKRLNAVQTKKLDETILCQIIKNSNEEKEILLAAVQKLSNIALCEKLFMEIYGNNAEEIRKSLLSKIADEQRIKTLYANIRKKGGLSFLEVLLELRLFDIWQEQFDKTNETNVILDLIGKSFDYVGGTYVSNMAYSITEKAILKMPGLIELAKWVETDFKYRKALHYVLRNALFERFKNGNASGFFNHISNLDLLLVFYKGGNSCLGLGATKRFTDLGKRVRIDEKDIVEKCSSCKGSGGGDRRVPYTDRDWEWAECESCNGTGKEERHIKEYFIENLEN